MLADEILPAFDSRARRTGLLTRTGLSCGQAMIIAPTSAIHTWFMRFPIDVAFVSRVGVVVKTSRSVHPWRMVGAWGAYAVIELPVGALAESGTLVGDKLAVIPDARSTPPARELPKELEQGDGALGVFFDSRHRPQPSVHMSRGHLE